MSNERNADYCREYAMDKALVIEFLESTQPEKMARLSRLLKAQRDGRIFAAINSASVGKDGEGEHPEPVQGLILV